LRKLRSRVTVTIMALAHPWLGEEFRYEERHKAVYSPEHRIDRHYTVPDCHKIGGNRTLFGRVIVNEGERLTFPVVMFLIQ